MPFDLVTPEPQTAIAKAFLTRPAHHLLINGQLRPAQSGETFETRDPASGSVLGHVARALSVDVDAAVAAARAALESGPWASMTPSARGQLLWKVGELLEARIDAFAEIETLDQGKPFFVGRWAEIPGAVEQFRFFGGQASKITGATIPTGVTYQPQGKQVFAYTLKEPVGVVAAIVPWNSPLVLTAMKLAPALAAGCTIVLKPAEDTSLSALMLGELFAEAGFPDGVVNVITGYGSEAGAALAAHNGVDKVAFTGSTQTGRAILDAAKGNLKRVSLELGGKSPVIILPDADLDAAIQGAANAIFFNSGQVCVAGSRLYAHASIFDKVVEGVAQIAVGMKLGHGLDQATQMGPLVSKAQADKVSGYLEAGKKAGARAIVGGEQFGPAGTFISPTIMTGIKEDMAIVRDEIFGPVLVAAPFEEVDEVINWANNSDYGLAASVWTQSLSHAHRLAGRIKAGTVWINTHSMYDCTLPIGGMKQSGWGRDSGADAIESYLEVKTVCAVL
jgi:phenylacetaldehyde dehydrogenase